jgi:hypothetical protein
VTPVAGTAPLRVKIEYTVTSGNPSKYIITRIRGTTRLKLEEKNVSGYFFHRIADSGYYKIEVEVIDRAGNKAKTERGVMVNPARPIPTQTALTTIRYIPLPADTRFRLMKSTKDIILMPRHINVLVLPPGGAMIMIPGKDGKPGPIRPIGGDVLILISGNKAIPVPAKVTKNWRSS